MYSLILKNEVTNRSYTLQNLEDLNLSAFNYTFNIQLPENMPTGEYTYRLIDENNALMATGMAQCGNYDPDTKPYTGSTHNGYKQYEG